MKQIIFFLTITVCVIADSNYTLSNLQNKYLKSSNVWIEIYKNNKELTEKKIQLNLLKKKVQDTNENSLQLEVTQQKITLLEEELKLIEDVGNYFEKNVVITVKDLDNISLGILSFLFKTHNKRIKRYEQRYKKLANEFKEASYYFDNFIAKNKIQDLKNSQEFLKEIRRDEKYFKASKTLLEKQLETIKFYKTIVAQKQENYINEELPNLILALFFLILTLLLFFLSRKIIDKKVEDEDKQFAYKNISNITFFIVSIIFIMFFFLENLFHAVTILGFIGAALIIISKEMFLNYPAWVYLQLTGFLKVGDRIKFIDQGEHCIGDIISISPLKITLYETINHTTLTEQKRAGRVLFFPPHYIFMRSIYNYTHEDMKTIFDLIEFNLILESNFPKAEAIAEKITLANTDKYIDLAAKQYNSLKRKYQMRNFNNRPQIQFIYNKAGAMSMFIWYVTPYREVLKVKSTITQEIVKEFLSCENIQLKVEE